MADVQEEVVIDAQTVETDVQKEVTQDLVTTEADAQEAVGNHSRSRLLYFERFLEVVHID